jgi:hypothetical protein
VSIRPPANYRVSRWLLFAVFAIAVLLSILASATSFADIVSGMLNSGR